ncbi:histone deacetylase [Elysia marginata]|uniref:Histone deacetylase n=1 Tax=Elysia marginata TaxID=1093978 RepID=A0AAV4F4K3_9GAST|nr:histone deacetylase [Elysia marginata]
MFYDDPRFLYVSIHRYEHGREWPNLREGDYDFTGEGSGKGYNINVPLNEIGCDNSDYLAIMFNLLLPIFYQFDPELVLVSAGYDCAIGCPEGEMSVTPACFAHFVNLLKPLAKGKLAIILEGGYNMKSLAESAALSLRALLNDPTPAISPITAPKHSVTESVLNCIKVMHQHWPCLQYQDFVEPQKVKAESYPYQGVLHLPPVKGVEFYTSQNRPEIFPLLQDCANDVNLQTQAYLNNLIEQLVQTTSLIVPRERLGFVYENGISTAILHHLKTRETFSSCQQLQEPLRPSGTASDCIKVAMDSLTSNEVQCCLCCLHSDLQNLPLNGKPVNGNSYSEPSLVNLIKYQAKDTHPVNRILVIDLNPESPPNELNSIESSSLLYVSVRVQDQEAEDVVVSPRALDIPLTQGISAVDFLHLFLQVILPLAYEFCPELVVFKLNDLKLLTEYMSRACIGHLTQLLLGLAGGKMLLLTKEVGQADVFRPRPGPKSSEISSGASGSQDNGKKIAADTACGDTGEREEGEIGAVLELFEEWAEVVMGAPCKELPAGPPSSR